jgi:hypothetical protein
MRYVVHNHFPARDEIGPQGDFVQAWVQAQNIDPLRYLEGLSKLTFVNDIDNHWNASYIPDSDEVSIAAKFHDKGFNDKVATLLHEGGHRGQKIDRRTFEQFKTLKLDRHDFFLVMANTAHRSDYVKNGISGPEMADEVFAESYSRYALGMEMPEPLRAFWTRRAL